MTSETDTPEYYLLVSENCHDWFKVSSHAFETMFEPINSDEECMTYQFNQEIKRKARESIYFSLDSYICGCEFNHARSDWRVSGEEFKVKGVYYWHNNIYSND